MKVTVVYDSAYGNTEQVARAIAGALDSPDEVELFRAADARPEQLAGVDLLVVGSPTQRFRPLPTTTSFLKAIPGGGLEGVKVAAFDTRITEEEIKKVRILAFLVNFFGYAAEPIAGRLEKKGGMLVVPAEAFYVAGTEGPLLDGEVDRAAEWAQQIVRK